MKLTEVKRQAIREEQGFSSQGYSAPGATTSASNGFAAFARKDKAQREPEKAKPVKEEKKVKADDKPKRKKGKATLDDFKEEFPKILQEFYTAEDMEEALGRLRDIGLAEAYHEEAVTEILFELSDAKPQKREKGLKLLAAAYSP